MPVPDCDPKQLQRTLLSEYNIEISCFKWQSHTIVRVSAQGYNTQVRMDLLVKALMAIIRR
jgi:isopenicillin-N epimerase